MRRVLISSIGRTYGPKESYSTLEYRSFDGKQSFKSCYVAEALIHFEKINKLIIVGTPGSDWRQLYLYMYYQPNNLFHEAAPDADDYDDAYYHQLEALVNNPEEHFKPLKEIAKLLKPLKKALRPELDADILLLKYGLDDAELQYNIETFYRIEDILEDGDEVILDVTHSFRSLPIFELLAIQYFTSISRKHIKITHLSYGMAEVATAPPPKKPDLEYAPIVDLYKLIQTMDYIKAAEEYNRFGTLHILADKPYMDDLLTTSQRRLVSEMSNLVSINNLDDFRDMVVKCHNYNTQLESQGTVHEMGLLAKTVFSEIDSTFYPDLNDLTATHLNLARWHFNKRRYVVAFTTAEECLITLANNLLGFPNTFVSRQTASGCLKDYQSHGPDTLLRDYKENYDMLRRLRNALAHPEGASSEAESNLSPRILVLKRAIERRQTNVMLQTGAEVLETLYRIHMQAFSASAEDSETNLQALKTALQNTYNSLRH